MKTIQRQFYDMLTPDQQRAKHLHYQRKAYFKSVAKALRRLGSVGVTAAQAARNLNASLEELRKKNQDDSAALDRNAPSKAL